MSIGIASFAVLSSLRSANVQIEQLQPFALRPWAKCTTTRSTIEAWQHAAAEHVALDGSQL